MATSFRAPANRKESNIWLNQRTDRWHWEVQLKRKDGSDYRKAGSRKTETEARASRDRAFAVFNQSEGKAGNWTIRSWAEHVQANIWPGDIAETTADAYAYSLANHVIPKLGGARLDAISVPQVQAWWTRLGHDVSVGAANNALTALSSILTRAVEAGLITSNPARNFRKPKEKVEKLNDVLATDHQLLLMEAATGTCMELPVLLGLKLGLRMGECLGLCWTDIDFESGFIEVRQQAQYVKGQGIKVTSTKSKSGKRTIFIPPSLRAKLEEAKGRSQSPFVVSKDGKVISSKKASTYFREVAVKSGAKTKDGIVPTHHDLRRTFLTWLANESNDGQGVKPSVLMKIAGHSTVETTMRYYVRVSDDDLRAAMQGVE